MEPLPLSPHPHCQRCVSRRCAYRPEPGMSCALSSCPLACGAIFHICKTSEHQLLCPLERVPCPNHTSGCPVFLVRGKTSEHLRTCPASVVCCSMEWNRWPVSDADRASYESLSCHAHRVEQLDVALALQDQRTLLESLRTAAGTSKGADAPPNAAKEKISNGIRGLSEESYRELYQATVETSRTLAAALDVLNSATKGGDAENEPRRLDGELGAVGMEVGGEAMRFNGVCSPVETLDDMELDLERQNGLCNAAGSDPPQDHPRLEVPPTVGLDDHWLEWKLQKMQALWGTGIFAFSGQRANPSPGLPWMEDKAVDTSDLKLEDDPTGLHGLDVVTASLLFCLGDSPGGRSISDSRFVDGYRVDLGTQTFSLPPAILTCVPPGPGPLDMLRLDLVLESVARYQTKQRSMFTFVCGQLFRRDEFASHFRNVHGDIHAGLNGWMERRCPLSHYGCTFSQRRFFPSVRGSRIIHDRHLRSFGVRLDPAPDSSPAPSDRLNSLPFEVLQHIASFLDGFSLCQLSRVSRSMRDLSASLLQTHGMVVLLWERRRRGDGSRASWQIKHKVWRFSTAFGPVRKWSFADVSSMSDHLKECPFNTVERRQDAVPLPCMCFTRELGHEGRSLRSVLKPIS